MKLAVFQNVVHVKFSHLERIGKRFNSNWCESQRKRSYIYHYCIHAFVTDANSGKIFNEF